MRLTEHIRPLHGCPETRSRVHSEVKAATLWTRCLCAGHTGAGSHTVDAVSVYWPHRCRQPHCGRGVCVLATPVQAATLWTRCPCTGHTGAGSHTVDAVSVCWPHRCRQPHCGRGVCVLATPCNIHSPADTGRPDRLPRGGTPTSPRRSPLSPDCQPVAPRVPFMAPYRDAQARRTVTNFLGTLILVRRGGTGNSLRQHHSADVYGKTQITVACIVNLNIRLGRFIPAPILWKPG
jgi:hypothetical protein